MHLSMHHFHLAKVLLTIPFCLVEAIFDRLSRGVPPLMREGMDVFSRISPLLNVVPFYVKDMFRRRIFR